MRFTLAPLSAILAVFVAPGSTLNSSSISKPPYTTSKLPQNSSSTLPALYQPHSDKTPVFQNQALLKSLSTNPKSGLSRRDESDDLSTGTCAPGTPCTNGACCSNTGVCSYAPSSCGADVCISNCDAKAPCGQYADPDNSTCPLNVCCSQYGFCGSTDEFCGTGCQDGYGSCGNADTPSCSGSSSSGRRVGYYEAWSEGSSRLCDKRKPSDLDLSGLTHVNFAFAYFDPTSFGITPMSSETAALYSDFTNLKTQKPSLQTWISIGGWSFNDDGNTPSTRAAFSDMVSTYANRAAFIKSLMSFMKTYGFDGVDLDWEYPAADDRGGATVDKENLVTFLKEMRATFGTTYGVSVTLPSSYWYLQHFDVVAMSEYLDWFNFMSYDIHGVWDSSNKYTGPYIRPHTNLTEIEAGLSLLWRAGVDPRDVTLGLGWYGRSFTLTDPDCNTPNGVCEFSAGGSPGECTASSGTLSNAEIKRLIASGVGTEGYDETAGVRWLTWDSNQWVSFDDGVTMQQKIDAANSLCLGGIMIWALDLDNTDGDSMDDLLGIGAANGVTEAQAQAYKEQMNNAEIENDIASSCYWTLCDETCSNGYFDVAEAKGQVASVQQNSVCPDDTHQTLCCAPGTTLGTCGWEGFRGIGMPCTPVCNSTDALIVAQNSNTYYADENGQTVDHTCTGGYQAYCCEGFKASSKTNTSDIWLYGQGALSKRAATMKDTLAAHQLSERGTKTTALTVGVCAAAVAALIAEAPFTFGISLLGIPVEIAVCAAAGIAISAAGYASKPSGSSQKGGPAKKIIRPYTGVPTTLGSGKKARSSYGQWPILDFGNAAQATSCDCSVTYTCNYGMGWDEICDNQRWAIDKILNGNTVYTPRKKQRAPKRNYSSWAKKQRTAQFRTLIQAKRTPKSARCELDEFPMGNLEESGQNQPQGCRLVNGPANGAQGNDWKMFKMAQYEPCSTFRSSVCKSKDAPPVTWEFGALNGNRDSGNGKHFITAYGFDSQTASSECFASYSYTAANGIHTHAKVLDHGFRVLNDDPLFGAPYHWDRQDYWMNPAPKNHALLRPTDIASAAWMKRASVEAVLRGDSVPEPDQLLCLAYPRGYEDDMVFGDSDEENTFLSAIDFDFVEESSGIPIDPGLCDVIFDAEQRTELVLDEEGHVFEVHEGEELRNVPITSVGPEYPEPTGGDSSTEPASPSSVVTQVPISATAGGVAGLIMTTAPPVLPTEWPSREYFGYDHEQD